MYSTEIKVKINRIDDVKRFVELTNKMPNVVDIASGRFVTDAKSIMGLFSMDLSKGLVVTVYGDLNPAFEYELRKFEVME